MSVVVVAVLIVSGTNLVNRPATLAGAATELSAEIPTVPTISSVKVSGSSGDYTITVKGSGFGASPVTTPYTGDTSYFRIGDNAEFGHGEWGFTGDANVLRYEKWSNTKVVVSAFGGDAGNAIVLTVWSTSSNVGVTWGGNDPPVPAGNPRISSVKFSGSGADLGITITGTGFGSAPVTMPYTGDLNDFFFGDFRSHCGVSSSLFSAGGSYFGDRSADAVTLNYQSWTNTQIQISGFAGAYGTGCAIVEAADPVVMGVFNSTATTYAGLQTAWGGNLSSQSQPTVTLEPSSQTTSIAGSASFVSAASGDPVPTVQWQVSTDGGGSFSNLSNGAQGDGSMVGGATTGTLTISNTQADQNGVQYRALFSNPAGSVPSDIATLTVTQPCNSVPTVTTQPVGQSISPGGTADFTSAATGCTPTVQWQVSSNSGSTWSNLSNGTQSDGSVVSGTTTDELAISNVQTDENGDEYEAVFTNSAGSSDSTSATLSVPQTCSAPTVTVQPQGQSISSGGAAGFTSKALAATGCTPTVQWQVSSNSGSTWSNLSNGTQSDGSVVSGAKKDELTISNAQTGENGNEYEAVFTNSAGSSDSNAATLTVQASCVVPTVTTEPVNQGISSGNTAVFTSVATGCTPTVQWKVSGNTGSTWSNLSNGTQSDGSVVSGATTDELTISNAQTDDNGDEYEAVFTNSAGSSDSNSATLSVQPSCTSPTVTGQPQGQSVSSGGTAGFTSTTSAPSGCTPTVQWQVSSNGGDTWSNLSNGTQSDGSAVSGATTDGLTISNAQTDENGDRYEAVFTNSAGSTPSNSATLSVQPSCSSPTVTGQPQGQSVSSGGSADFTSSASAPAGCTLTVQWEVSSNGGDTWSNLSNGTQSDGSMVAGDTTDELTISNAQTDENGHEYRVVFSDSAGSSDSNAAMLAVQPSCTSPTVTGQPQGQSVSSGGSAEFTSSASAPAGCTLTVQWEVSSNGGDTWSNLSNGTQSDGSAVSGATTDGLTISNAQTDENGHEYRAVFTNSAGSTPSNAATLTVQPTCVSNVSFGSFVAVPEDGSCLAQSGTTYTDTGPVRLNGLDIVPSSGEVTISSSAETISATDASVEIDGFTLYAGPLSQIDLGVLPFSLSIDDLDDFADLPLSGVDLSATPNSNGGGGLTLTFAVTLPSELDDAPGALVTVNVDNDNGFVSAEVSGENIGISVGAESLTIKSFSLMYLATENQWSGLSEVELPISDYSFSFSITITNGQVTAFSASLSDLDVPLADSGAFLQSLGVSVVLSPPPPSIAGSIGLSAGPAIFGDTAVSIDGLAGYTFSNPGKLALSGTLNVVDYPLASGYLDYYTDGEIDLGGSFNISLDAFGLVGGELDANLGGWLSYADGAQTFSITGSGTLTIQLPVLGDVTLAGASTVVSNLGFAACASSPLGSSGFGYSWTGGLTTMATGCSTAAWSPPPPSWASTFRH